MLFPAAAFDHAGLNRQHVFDLTALPENTLSTLGDCTGYQQLILLGHGGTLLWDRVQASGLNSEHPIDDYVRLSVDQVFAEHLPSSRYELRYPGETPVGLQQLGSLAGWHNPSPFMVGIDQEWGSWFAYRAVILADTGFMPFATVHRSSPCLTCASAPCRSTCPADALLSEGFSLNRCITYRRQADSACQNTCLARMACPVGEQHRYSTAQMHHTYSRSLQMIERYATAMPKQVD